MRLTLAEDHAASWIAWHEDFVVKGNNSHAQEKNGSLTFLAPNIKDVLGLVDSSPAGG